MAGANPPVTIELNVMILFFNPFPGIAPLVTRHTTLVPFFSVLTTTRSILQLLQHPVQVEGRRLLARRKFLE